LWAYTSATLHNYRQKSNDTGKALRLTMTIPDHIIVQANDGTTVRITIENERTAQTQQKVNWKQEGF